MTPLASPSLKNFDAPATRFDDPLATLQACHDRLCLGLSMLREIGERVASGRLDGAVHGAAADVLRYFDHAAPHHHEDEEQHIFPCVLERTVDDSVRAAVLGLQEDHLAMESQWARLRVPLAALANGRAEAYDLGQIEAMARFCALYASHARREEEVVFPLAALLLDRTALQAMGAEMAGRRRARGT